MKSINQMLSDILMNIYTYCFVSFLLSILTSALLAIVKFKGIKFLYNIIVENIKKSDLIKQTIFLFFVYLILNRTVIGRNVWVNPWSDVLGRWSIFMEDGSLNLDFIENIILFIPLGFMYNWTYHDSVFWGINKIISKTDVNTEFHLNNKINTIKKTLLGSLRFSLLIECTQLMLKIGIFQLSDIFCNTLGGALGATMYILVKTFISCKNKGILGDRHSKQQCH